MYGYNLAQFSVSNVNQRISNPPQVLSKDVLDSPGDFSGQVKPMMASHKCHHLQTYHSGSDTHASLGIPTSFSPRAVKMVLLQAPGWAAQLRGGSAVPYSLGLMP